MRKTILPIFLANAGCSDRCVFCNQLAVESIHCNASVEIVKAEIDRQIRYLRGSEIQLAFYGGTFTAIPEQQQLSLLRYAKQMIDCGEISSVRVSTRPDVLTPDIVQNLYTHGVTDVEIGAQSLCDSVLVACNRRHDYAAVCRGVKCLNQAGVRSGLHLMTGLPGETDKTFLLTLQRLLQLSPDMLRIHPTIILRNTELERLYYRGEYLPQTMEQALTSASWLKLFAQSRGIKVIRTGIQPSDELRDGKVVAGPFHPAFGEMADNCSFFCLMELLIRETGCRNFACNRKEYSKVVGQRRANIAKLEAKYAAKVNVVADDSLQCGEISSSCGIVKSISSIVDTIDYYKYISILGG